MKPRMCIVACAIIFLASCGGGGGNSGATTAAAVKTTAWTFFSGDRAYADVKALVDIGARPSGSPGILKAQDYIQGKLRSAGWEVQRQEFNDYAGPLRGTLPFVNIRARFPVTGTDMWNRRIITVVGSHYDTKWFQSASFVGANDGGSSSGLLLEIARATAKVPTLASQLELVFFDGEEAVTDFTTPGGFSDTRYDGLFGSRHYALKLRNTPRDALPRHGIVFDMIGDQELQVEFPGDGSRRLIDISMTAAGELGFQKHFNVGAAMIDDHVPLSWLGMEVINFIDFTSYRDAGYWHTSQDTMEKISTQSIEKAGRTGLILIEKISYSAP